jgi:serine palmitoyltransferase
MNWPTIQFVIQTYAYRIYELVLRLPLGPSIIRYIKNSYQHDPFRIFLEVLLAIFTVKYILSRPYSRKGDDIVLSEKEVEELVQEWEPEPLVPQDGSNNEAQVDSIPILQG